MIAGIFGWPISGDDFTGIILTILMMGYLVYVLLKPEGL